MYDTLLFFHFFGISIGAGTGIYMFALARYAATNLEQSEARTLMPGISGAMSRVGNIGLLLLIGSGVSMGIMLGQAVLSPLFILKMLLVVLIVIFVATMNYLAAQVTRIKNNSSIQLMNKLKLLGPVLGISTILVAVMAFH